MGDDVSIRRFEVAVTFMGEVPSMRKTFNDLDAARNFARSMRGRFFDGDRYNSEGFVTLWQVDKTNVNF